MSQSKGIKSVQESKIIKLHDTEAEGWGLEIVFFNFHFINSD